MQKLISRGPLNKVQANDDQSVANDRLVYIKKSLYLKNEDHTQVNFLIISKLIHLEGKMEPA